MEGHEAGPVLVYTHKPTTHVAEHKRSRVDLLHGTVLSYLES